MTTEAPVAPPTVTGEPVAVVPAPDTAAVAARPAPVLPVMTFDDILKMGDALVKTGLLPRHVNTGAKAAAIILAGRELGMTEMRAFRSLQVVEGKITESADSQLGRFKVAGGQSRFVTLTDTEAVLWLRHPNGDEHTEAFTIEDAERAELTRPTRNGEPSNYHKHPKAMLRSRVITAGLKSLGWDGAVDVYDPQEVDGVLTVRPSFHEVVIDPQPPTGGALPAGSATAPKPEEEAPTDKQRALLDRLMQSPVFTDRERAAAKAILTKRRMSQAIEYAQSQLAAHKKAQDEGKARVQAATNAAIAEHHALAAGGAR